ncbi:diguanylate cyclase [Thermosipho melanesiensis]|uniref:Diguanylate cyclase n=3 Tax=Thermosipho melanesiensis TaxID=46541 RepID=A6LP30_THEM4|nr:GGDEF domain-containing protein [Thermosipho melanesiensis]ABR31681.1 diguanylate cyclase [Thermosipho melanesiensis BI429]APT74707.1 diguanylate cyclase [Thermosipho melanesiensis]OOC35205.1 diguanylate cyclase [Thermosipho melanesiensis]OOC35415.1 diguanylate cyclase [Thermosipho melanesiensis]OOC36666.1 diguanylate cyclase [Thermosipho melanesiensis]
MSKIGDIILKANNELKEKALFPLFSIFVVDIVGTIEKREFLEKLCKSIFNILHSVVGVIVLENEKIVYKYGNFDSEFIDFSLDKIMIKIYHKEISNFEENLLKYILAIAEIHYDNVKKFEIMKENAFFDELTGALTRKAGFEMLSKKFHELKRENKIGTLIFIDLDGLKKVNDLHGHLEGDKLLKEFVYVSKEFIRKGDFVVRLGGDEFVIFVNSEHGDAIVSRIKNHTRANFSWGSVNIPAGFKDIVEAIEKADKKMYKQKILKKYKKQ